jgi:hypothetical protein
MENALAQPVIQNQKSDRSDEHQTINLDIAGTDNVASSAVDASTQVVVHSVLSVLDNEVIRFTGFQVGS